MIGVRNAFMALLIALVGMGGWLMGGGAANVGLAQAPIDNIPGSQLPQNSLCYLVQGGNNPAAAVLLNTRNFGNDQTRVAQLVLMCESAVKYPPQPTTGGANLPPPTSTVVTACYLIQDGTNPNDPYRLTTSNFGADDVVVGTGIFMCEQATKLRDPVPGTVPPNITPPANPFVQECYVLKNGATPNKPFTLVTNNFGPDPLVVQQALIMCETAAKLHPTAAGVPAGAVTGAATGEVAECYRVRDGANPQARVALATKNFGTTFATVGPAVLMCEQARKTPTFSLPVPFTGSSGRLSPILNPDDLDRMGDRED